jgi:hypothetical protein
MILTALFLPSLSCGPSLQVTHTTEETVILLSFILKMHVGSTFVRSFCYRPVRLHFPEGRNFNKFSIDIILT